MGAVDDEDLSALLDEAEDGGARRAACAQDDNARALEPQAFFERADDAGHVGIEAVELAVGAGTQGVAGADAGGERVHVGQMGQQLLLERHGDGHAAEGQLADECEQVIERLDLEGQHDGVHAFAAEGGVVHERRKGVGDGVACHAEDAGGLVELLETVEIEHGACGNLAGRGCQRHSARRRQR